MAGCRYCCWRWPILGDSTYSRWVPGDISGQEIPTTDSHQTKNNQSLEQRFHIFRVGKKREYSRHTRRVAGLDPTIRLLIGHRGSVRTDANIRSYRSVHEPSEGTNVDISKPGLVKLSATLELDMRPATCVSFHSFLERLRSFSESGTPSSVCLQVFWLSGQASPPIPRNQGFVLLPAKRATRSTKQQYSSQPRLPQTWWLLKGDKG